MMTIRKVSCQGCGASLEVSEDVRYVTCNYCDASLEIVHDTTVTHSLLLKKLERNTDRLIDEVTELRLARELELLDAAWQKFCKATFAVDSDGTVHEPSENESRGLAVIGIVVGVVICVAAAIGGSPFYILPGGALIALAAASFSRTPKLVTEYRKSKAVYQRRRQEVLDGMQACRSRRRVS
ncbi:MAG: hypothetical protein JWO82_4267 [Akkermansiaceae bacterium]|nr:hypothetical protein [Akkermansiaceae bacterium]